MNADWEIDDSDSSQGGRLLETYERFNLLHAIFPDFFKERWTSSHTPCMHERHEFSWTAIRNIGPAVLNTIIIVLKRLGEGNIKRH